MAARLPAEWEPQDAVLLAWPHKQTDWSNQLEAVEQVYCALTQAICRFQRVIIITPDPDPVRATLQELVLTDPTKVSLVTLPTNDTWIRDYGPITTCSAAGATLLDFGFNAWGLKFAADLDNQVTNGLVQQGLFGANQHRRVGLILEGGSIESDGHGTLLTTSSCLLEANRNPHLNRTELETRLGALFGSSHFLWLHNGFLAGDDTDAHIDTLARFAPNYTIFYVQCTEPQDEHYQALGAMEKELQALRTPEGRPYHLIPLPWPSACFAADGHRLPATYANFLYINGALLVPVYGVAEDRQALDIFAQSFPEREIIAINCRPLIEQHGSLHCITMQLPKGVLKP